MTTHTFPLKYRRKSSPPPSPKMLSPIVPFSSAFISPPPKWLDSDDDFDHEPALTSDDALTVFSSSCSRAPSLAPLDAEDPHVDIVSSPVREIFFRAPPSSRAPLPKYSMSYSPDTKSSSTREDVAAALLSLHSQPRLDPSRPVLPRPLNQTEVAQPPPARRRRVVTPSLRNLVLPRTPSPPPRSSLPLTTPSPVIDDRRGHAIFPAQRTPYRHATPASSPLPPSSPFAEEADCDTSELIIHHSVPCSKPKPELFQARTSSDGFEANKIATPWSRDDEPKQECDHLLLVEHKVLRALPSLEASLVTAMAPDERHLAAPPVPLDTELSSALSPKSVDECEILLSTPDDSNGAWQRLHGSHLERIASAIPSTPAQSSVSLENPCLDDAGQNTPVAPSSYSRAASSALTAFDYECSSAPSSPPHDFPVSSPLSSPPSSPFPDQRREVESPSCATGAGTKRHVPTPVLESDSDVSTSAPPERAPSRTKRRRVHMDSDDDKPWHRSKNLSRASAPVQQQALIPSLTHSPIPTSPPRASSSTTPNAAMSSSSPILGQSPHAANAIDGNNSDGNHDGDDDDDEAEEEHQSCPHPALLGILIEDLALSRASSLPLSTLTRTNPALASYPDAVITSTLAWAVRSRVLGCVRSSGEALPPSYFYDPAADPDRERGELLRCLMPRAGKRRETMKYKQYYWAPVVVGRGRTRTWDVDWEE